MAKRLGMGGEVDFTTAAVGQTLHLYCGAGDHVVDVHIAARQHPDAVAKKLLGAGWIMGSKLKCPEHSRRKAGEPRKPKGKFLSEAAPMSAQLSHIADQILDGTLAIKVSDEPQQYEPPLSRNQRRVVDRAVAKATPVERPAPKIQGVKPMPEAAQKPVVPTDAAKKAKRMVFLLLEEQYDESKKCYRPGWDDKKIATESGAHVKVVEDTRVEFFGPLGEPAELTALRNEFAAHRQDAEAKIRAINESIASMQSRFTRLCVKNGWSE